MRSIEVGRIIIGFKKSYTACVYAFIMLILRAVYSFVLKSLMYIICIAICYIRLYKYCFYRLIKQINNNKIVK